MQETDKMDWEVSRRALVKGAVWSVPVVAIAVGTPLTAASGFATYDVTLGPVALTSPPPSGGDFSELVPASLNNPTMASPSGPVAISVPNEPNGYWVLTRVLRPDGSVDMTATLTATDGLTLITFSSPPAAGSTYSFQLELTYQWNTWDHDYVVQPDDSQLRIDRPDSSLTATINPDGSSPQGATSTVPLPGYASVIGAP